MDAHKIGGFIAQRRKSLGMTQAELAEQLYVTDKAVSRWERGVGLPDINMLEPLAQKLDVKLVDLIQAEITQRDTITIREVENIVSDTIQLSQKKKAPGWLGGAILAVFGAAIIFLLGLWVTEGSVVAYSVGSLVAGLVAWGIPIWQITLAKKSNPIVSGVISLGAALTSLTIQFFQIAENVRTGDFAAVEDTIHALCIVVALFSMITLLLNVLMAKKK